MPTPATPPSKTRTIILAVAIGFAIVFFTAFCVLLLLKQSAKHQSASTNTDSTTRSYNGIDVSHHQGTIDWGKVAQDTCIQFVYIKATEGKTYVDETFQYNMHGARKNGLHAGAYQYFSMKSGAHEQFDNFRVQLNKTDFDLIPMVDVELNPKNNAEKKRLQDSLAVFIGLIEQHYGVSPLIYGTNKSINQNCVPRFNNHLYYIGRYGANPPVLTQGDYAI